MAHTHTHSHGPANYGRAFALGVVLNTGFVILEATYGYWSHSLALIADAGHNLSDVLSLLLAWGAAWLAQRQVTQYRTYGFRRSSILAALVNAVLLRHRTHHTAGRNRKPKPALSFLRSDTPLRIARAADSGLKDHLCGSAGAALGATRARPAHPARNRSGCGDTRFHHRRRSAQSRMSAGAGTL
jgi:hypothetical protein